jgi:hypothetical protein
VQGEFAVFQHADGVGEALYFLQVVTAQKHCALAVAEERDERIEQVLADDAVESAERFVENEHVRLVAKRAEEGGFHALAARELAELLIERDGEELHQPLGQGVVPGGIHGLEELQEFAQPHPSGQVLIFADVS